MRTLLAALILATAACATVPPAPTATGTCDGFCAHARAMGCSFGQPSPKGVTCEDICRNANTLRREDGELADPWPLGCMSSAATCEDVDRCDNGK